MADVREIVPGSSQLGAETAMLGTLQLGAVVVDDDADLMLAYSRFALAIGPGATRGMGAQVATLARTDGSGSGEFE